MYGNVMQCNAMQCILCTCVLYSVWMDVCVQVCMYVCMYVCMHAGMYIVFGNERPTVLLSKALATWFCSKPRSSEQKRLARSYISLLPSSKHQDEMLCSYSLSCDRCLGIPAWNIQEYLCARGAMVGSPLTTRSRHQAQAYFAVQ